MSVFIVVQSAGKPAQSEIVKFDAGFIAVQNLQMYKLHVFGRVGCNFSGMTDHSGITDHV